MVTWSQRINPCTIRNKSLYLGHLDHVGKLCETGDGDHIMVGFKLVPGEVIKHSVWFQLHIMWYNIFLEAVRRERDDPVYTIIELPHPCLLSLPPSIPTHSLA